MKYIVIALNADEKFDKIIRPTRSEIVDYVKGFRYGQEAIIKFFDTDILENFKWSSSSDDVHMHDDKSLGEFIQELEKIFTKLKIKKE